MSSTNKFQVVDIADVIEEEADLASLLAAHGNGDSAVLFVLVSSDWCPDCVKGSPRVAPAIEAEAAKHAAGAVLIKLNAGERAVWRDPHHAYRESNIVRTKSIPTLFHIAAGRTAATLVESRLYEPADDLAHFVSTAFASSAKL